MAKKCIPFEASRTTKVINKHQSHMCVSPFSCCLNILFHIKSEVDLFWSQKICFGVRRVFGPHTIQVYFQIRNRTITVDDITMSMNEWNLVRRCLPNRQLCEVLWFEKS